MTEVFFQAEARAELFEGKAHYDGECPGLGEAFLAEVERITARMAVLPESFPPHALPDYRKAVLRRFPYTLYCIPWNGQRWITAVAHQRRKPGYWHGRAGKA